MQRAFNIVLTLVFSLVILGPTFIFSAETFGVQLPTWLTSEDARYLSGDFTEINLKESLTFENYLNRAFQTTLENELSYRIPCKAEAMMANAAWQRTCITLANAPFAWDAYPTFFASGRMVSSNTGALYLIPANESEYPQKKLENARNRIASLAELNPRIDLVLCLIPNNETTSVNPASHLVSNRADYSDIVARLRTLLDGVNCVVLNLEYNDELEYLSDFFATDHHMQVQGGVRACEKILSAFGKEPIDVDGFEVAVSDDFYGSNARAGLDAERSDVVWDIVYTRSNLAVTKDDTPSPVETLDKGWAASPYEKVAKYANVYADYFHGDYRTLVIENLDLDESVGSLLIVSDSFDNSTDRLYAERYKRVYDLECRSGIDVAAFLSEHPDIVDAAFVICPNNLGALLAVK